MGLAEASSYAFTYRGHSHAHSHHQTENAPQHWLVSLLSSQGARSVVGALKGDLMPLKRPPPLTGPVPFGQLRPLRSRRRGKLGYIVLVSTVAALLACWEANFPDRDPWIADARVELLAQDREDARQQPQGNVLTDADGSTICA